MKFLPAFLFVFTISVHAQKTNPYKADFTPAKNIPGMQLVWSDEFNTNGKPDPKNWTYENGFVRNRELQWYQAANANCINGILVIEGRKENIPNPSYKEGSTDWRAGRQFAQYTSASIRTQGLFQWMYGRLEVRAKIDTALGAWPAIWTLGATGRWPLGGEIDIMEFYRSNNTPTILANAAWGRNEKGAPIWNTKKIPLSHFTANDPDWPNKFHVWRMDWTKDVINLYLDDELLNTQPLDQTLNPDGSNPFQQPHYLLLNLALGENGGDPSYSKFPIRYEVDYVRLYKQQ
jgi:beta-glucanase (GH16 family)